ncbi:right-handed parallel beta-helix repeat-containing protein [Priestia sp. 40]|uniref:right-handed parallel beta-helix repeat-containing protein n=1 Tax=Priestia TaxID=2800373 RepID=UPI000E1B276B|nr:right-handed parallel beta-helix repeat-containing protein [Priestia megaterium]SUV05563.1 putative uronase [Priestia megaterium]
MKGKIKKLKNGNEYAYPITVSEAVYINESTSLATFLDNLGGVWSYVLDLKRWGVRNDIEDLADKNVSLRNSKGINSALTWASEKGYKEIILPRGTYLIDEEIPIEPKSFMTLNLGGSTLRIRDNGLQGYKIISYNNRQRFSRVTNGILEGDRITHNYSTEGSHEHGLGISIVGDTRFISIDNLEIFNFTGDAIAGSARASQVVGFYFNSTSFEQGGIDANTGTLVNDSTRVRYAGKISMTSYSELVENGYFSIQGDGYGGLGTEITVGVYNVFFYKNDDTFLSCEKGVQFFDEIDIPEGASYAKIVLNQSLIPTTRYSMTLHSAKIPKNTYIERCNLHHNRRQGISIGGKWVFIRDNEIHHIGGIGKVNGTPPMGGIDIEDGYAANQYIFIDNNHFHHNANYNIVMKSARNIRITRNRLVSSKGSNGLAVTAGCDMITVSQNTIQGCSMSLYGEIMMSDNYLYGCQIFVTTEDTRDKEVIIDSCHFRNCSININKIAKYKVRINNCIFINDLDKKAVELLSTISFDSQPQILSNCTFRGDDVNHLFNLIATVNDGWIFDNVIFTGMNKGISLPPGSYTGCTFNKCGTIDVGISGATYSNLEYQFNQCKVIIDDATIFNINNCKSIVISDCDIKGTKGYAFRFYDFKEFIFKNNRVEYTSTVDTSEFFRVESSFKGNKILIDGNDIVSTVPKKFVEIPSYKNMENVETTIKNNYFININYSYKEFNKNVDKYNNTIDMVQDPYYKMSSKPSSGFYNLGQEVKNLNPIPGGFVGWICTTPGYVSNKAWVSSTNYLKDTIIQSGGHVYQAQNSGTSGITAPAFPKTFGGIVIDNNITWKQLSLLAVFKEFGYIQN